MSRDLQCSTTHWNNEENVFWEHSGQVYLRVFQWKLVTLYRIMRQAMSQVCRMSSGILTSENSGIWVRFCGLGAAQNSRSCRVRFNSSPPHSWFWSRTCTIPAMYAWKTGNNLVMKIKFIKIKLSAIHHIRILKIGLVPACSGGSCGDISLKRDKLLLHLKRLLVLASVAS